MAGQGPGGHTLTTTKGERSEESRRIGRALVDRLDWIIQEIEAVDLRVPEDSALIGLATDQVPKVTRLLREGLAFLTEIEKRYDPGDLDAESSERSGFDSLQAIGQLISAETAGREVADLAFFAQADLRASLEILIGSTTRNNILLIASNCEAGLRRLRKALVSVELALCEYEGLAAPAREWHDVELSLQIRKLYGNLRRELATQEGDGRLLEDRLRAILYRLLAFREQRIYPFLRVDDRVALRDLLSRIVDWLNSSERAVIAGRRLWEDLAGFAQLLAHVSNRQELREHDSVLVRSTYHLLFQGTKTRKNVPEGLLEEMEALFGLDDELDQLILRRITSPVELWRPPLERLLGRLSYTRRLFPASSPDDDEAWPE